MENNAHINARLKEILDVIDARAYVNLFKKLKNGKEKLLRTCNLYNLLSDSMVLLDYGESKVIGFTVTLGAVNILIEEA